MVVIVQLSGVKIWNERKLCLYRKKNGKQSLRFVFLFQVIIIEVVYEKTFRILMYSYVICGGMWWWTNSDPLQ